MEVMETESFSALVFKNRLTLKDLNQHVVGKADELHRLAISKGLSIAGPVYWIYNGSDGNPETLFELTIAIPVIGDLQNIACEQVVRFKGLWQMYKGPWNEMGAVYGQLIQSAMQQNMKLTGECRELYLQVDLQQPENNLTFVGVGVE
jgi:effector-binding domain-containing protein